MPFPLLEHRILLASRLSCRYGVAWPPRRQKDRPIRMGAMAMATGLRQGTRAGDLDVWAVGPAPDVEGVSGANEFWVHYTKQELVSRQR